MTQPEMALLEHGNSTSAFFFDERIFLVLLDQRPGTGARLGAIFLCACVRGLKSYTRGALPAVSSPKSIL